jgi:hypothetical protein
MSDTGPEPTDQPAAPGNAAQPGTPAANVPQPPPAAPPAAQPPPAQPSPAAPPTTPYAAPPAGPPVAPGYATAPTPLRWPGKPRWIAPERKLPVVVISIVTALVLLGIGFVGGRLVSRHQDRFVPFQRGGYVQQYPQRDGRNIYPGPMQRLMPSATPSTTS